PLREHGAHERSEFQMLTVPYPSFAQCAELRNTCARDRREQTVLIATYDIPPKAHVTLAVPTSRPAWIGAHLFKEQRLAVLRFGAKCGKARIAKRERRTAQRAQY